MKAVVLCGGLGTRLGAVTAVVNKHLLPVGTRPMIAHAIEMAHLIGFRDVLLVTNPQSIGQFASLFELNEYPFNAMRGYFTSQAKPIGIANAIQCSQEYCNSGPVLVILGDNIYDITCLDQIIDDAQNLKGNFGCHIWCAKCDDPREYGVLELNDKQEIINIHEKPEHPTSNLATTGIYAFDSEIWGIIKNLKPSARNEYEVTDAIKSYLPNVTYHVLKGDWADLGKSVVDYFRHASL